MIGAYGLSESGSGSDESARATSHAPAGRQLLLHGEKMWSTNGGFADLSCLAKVTGELTVPREAVRCEEQVRKKHKMGFLMARDTPTE